MEVRSHRFANQLPVTLSYQPTHGNTSLAWVSFSKISIKGSSFLDYIRLSSFHIYAIKFTHSLSSYSFPRLPSDAYIPYGRPPSVGTFGSPWGCCSLEVQSWLHIWNQWPQLPRLHMHGNMRATYLLSKVSLARECLVAKSWLYVAMNHTYFND